MGVESFSPYSLVFALTERLYPYTNLQRRLWIISGYLVGRLEAYRNGSFCSYAEWLAEIFDRYTKKKSGNRRRLLIVDGHSSHVHMQFMEKCDELRILLLILPPHSTHRLQPLDVLLFAPLSSFYSTAANALLTDSLGLINLSKRAFWSFFYSVWQQAFTPTNIASGFARTGILPYNPPLLIDIITNPKPPTPPPVSAILKTPMTNRAVLHMQRNYKNAPSSPLLAKIFRVNEKLATLHSLNSHMIAGLKRVVILEKKRDSEANVSIYLEKRTASHSSLAQVGYKL